MYGMVLFLEENTINICIYYHSLFRSNYIFILPDCHKISKNIQFMEQSYIDKLFSKKLSSSFLNYVMKDRLFDMCILYIKNSSSFKKEELEVLPRDIRKYLS